MKRKPHTPETKEKIRLARLGKPLKWKNLPEMEIVEKWLNTNATTRTIAAEFGCGEGTIKIILHKHTTKEQRLATKVKKQSESLKGYKHSEEFAKNHSKYMRSEKNPWLGRKHSAETKAKQSVKRLGTKQTMAQKIASSASRQGIPVSEWKGFISTENERARRGIEFKKWREAVFAKHPELRFEVSNGATLCATPCHKQTIGKEEEFEYLFEK